MRSSSTQTKSSTNRLKHGIDFNDAQTLWNDPDRLEIDREAGRLGVTRQAFITARLADAVLPRRASPTN